VGFQEKNLSNYSLKRDDLLVVSAFDGTAEKRNQIQTSVNCYPLLHQVGQIFVA